MGERRSLMVKKQLEREKTLFKKQEYKLTRYEIIHKVS